MLGHLAVLRPVGILHKMIDPFKEILLCVFRQLCGVLGAGKHISMMVCRCFEVHSYNLHGVLGDGM